MPAELIPLGTNGYYPSFGRQTMSVLLLDRGRALLLDAGTGVGRMSEPEVARRLAAHDSLNIVLTHYHLDHVVGLATLLAVWDRPVRLYAPEPPLVDGRPDEALGLLIAPPLFPRALADYPFPVEVVPYSESSLEAGGFRLTVRRQRHPGGSAGLRVDDLIAYCTDTAADPETVELVRGVPTLLHEVWLDGEEARRSDPAAFGHASAPQVARLASEAGVGRLIPIHHHPTRDDAALQRIATELREAGAPEVVLPDEGTVLSLA
ncbi:MAG: MBL fold metallo-hydrolase [Thermoanaerobaculia bacterium]